MCQLKGTCVVMRCTIPIYIILRKYEIVAMGNEYPLTLTFSYFKDIKIYISRNGFLEDLSPHFTLTKVAIIAPIILLKKEKKLLH